MPRNFQSEYLVSVGRLPSSCATDAQATALYDMSDYRSIIGIFHSSVAATSCNIHAEGCTAASTTGGTAAVDLTGTQVDATATGDGNVILELHEPSFRYIRFVTAGSTGALSAVTVLRGPCGIQPVTQTADIELHAGVTSGTI